MMNGNENKFLRKAILFFVGFCSYITIEVCFCGYSYPLMGICGGLLMVVIDMVNDKISWDIDLILYGCIGSAIITFMELVIGELWKLIGFAPMWDYSNLPLNFDGVICLPFSLVWIALSIVGILVDDAINYYVFEILPVPYYRIFGKIRLRFKEKSVKPKE